MLQMNEAYQEVYETIQHFEPELYKRIPEKFIRFLDEVREKEYKTSIDFSKNINIQDIDSQTRTILAIIYRDFICNEDEKNRIQMEEIDYLNNKYKFDCEKVFKKGKINHQKKYNEIDNLNTNDCLYLDGKDDNNMSLKEETKGNIIIYKKETRIRQFVNRLKIWFQNIGLSRK